MSRKRAKRRDLDFINDDEDEDSGGEAPRKKSTKKEPRGDGAIDAAEGIVACEMSKNRKVTVRSFKGNLLIDIREFYVKDGENKPGRKGISLNLDQWKVLRSNMKKVDRAIEEYG